VTCGDRVSTVRQEGGMIWIDLPAATDERPHRVDLTRSKSDQAW
jgi:hypothetical protein